MLTIEQIAANLGVATDSPLAQEIYKTTILKEKGFKDVSNTKGKFYLTPEDAKELAAVGPIDDSLFIPGVDYAANEKQYKEVLSRKLTLDQAFELVQASDLELSSTDKALKAISEKGIDMKFNGKIYPGNTIYINSEKFENIDLDIFLKAYCLLFLEQFQIYKNKLDKESLEQHSSLMNALPKNITPNQWNKHDYKKIAALSTRWAQVDWDGRTADEIMNDEII